MKTNAELAPASVRHFQGSPRLASGGPAAALDELVGPLGLETKASRPLGPISQRLAQRRAADPTRAVVEAINSSTREIKAAVTRVQAVPQSTVDTRHRNLRELRATAVQRDRLVRRGRGDVLLDQKMAQLNAAIDRAHEQEVRELRDRNRHLERKAARPLGPTRGVAGARSQQAHNVALYRKAAVQYLRTGEKNYMGQPLRVLERKVGLNTEMLPQGGVFVHPEYDTSVEKLLQEVVPMRQLATVRSISAGSFKKAVNLRGTEAQWVDERTTPRQETEGPEVDELDFPAHELHAKPLATRTLLEDSLIDIEGWLSEEVLDAFALAEGVAYLSGDGIKRPRGLLTYPTVADADWAWGKIGYVATGVDGGFAAPGAQVNQGDKLWSLIYALKQGHRQSAKFLMNRGTIGLCRTLKDGEGRWIWADARDGNPNALCGYEVVEGEQMPDVAIGSMSIAFGDFAKTYLIVDRLGVMVLRDEYTKYPYVLFNTRKRVGGGVQNFETIKLMKFASS